MNDGAIAQVVKVTPYKVIYRYLNKRAGEKRVSIPTEGFLRWWVEA